MRLFVDPDWLTTLMSPFVIRAFVASIGIALVCGMIGYFTIARNATFASHALAHIGLPGATGAVLLGLPAALGFGVFAFAGALVIACLGKRAAHREIATGAVLAFCTGLGLFFARLSGAATKQIQSILFGSILSISYRQIFVFFVLAAALLIIVSFVYRPLLFSSLDEQVAQSKGVPIGALNILFMTIMALCTTLAVPAVGTLLVFALVITPSASAMSLTVHPFRAMVISTFICLACLWGGLFFSVLIPTPPSFFIVSLSTLIWIAAAFVHRFRAA